MTDLEFYAMLDDYVQRKLAMEKEMLERQHNRIVRNLRDMVQYLNTERGHNIQLPSDLSFPA